MEWRAVPVTFVTASYTPSAYWTNQPTVAECRHNPRYGGHTTCGPPVESVAAHGVLVIVVSMPNLGRSFRPDRMIAGHKAFVAHRACAASSCYPGAHDVLSAEIRVPSRTLEVTAYFGAGGAQLERRMRQVLATARSA